MEDSFWKFFTVLFLIGLINNFSYVLIGTGAQSIASHFNKQDLMPLFQLMLVSCSIPMLAINFRYLSSINTLARIAVTCGAMLVSFLVMSLCLSTNESWGFPISLMATLLMGLAQCIGECVNLGFLKAFPSEHIVGFTSGTGFAGIAGAGAWLFCRAIGLNNTQVFLVFMPLLVVYFLSFLWLYRKGNSRDNTLQYSMVEGNLLDTPTYNSKDLSEKPKKSEEKIAVTGNELFSIALMKSVWGEISFWGLNLAAVYFLEYSIITGFADRATLKYTEKNNFVKENAYEIINFCYQLGVWVSRSSLKFFKVEKVWIVTVLQAINWVIWWLEAEFLFLTEWGEFALTLWVGCMGGLAYVNTGYLILNSEKIPKEQKEAGMNITLCLNALGVLLASLFCLVLDNLIIKE